MTRATKIRMAGMLAALGGIWIAMTQQQPAELTMEKVADDLYVIIGDGGNVAVYNTDAGPIVVDDKYERDLPQILAKIKSVTTKPIKYLLNTHHHGDHTGGNQQLLLASTEIIAHENARANLVKNNMPGLQPITFSDELVVDAGGKEVRARYFGRGHTNGDAVIYFPAHKIIHTGDLFVRGSPFIDYDNGGSSDAWMRTIDGILATDFEVVIPGHGPVSKREDLMRWKADFEKVRERVRQLSRDGKSRDEVATQLKIDDLPGWSMGPMFKNGLPRLYDEVRVFR